MFEHHSPNLASQMLEKMQKQDGTCVTIDQILSEEVDLDDMVSKGLKVLCLCKEGKTRSRIKSEELTRSKKKVTPAIYLRDGLDGLIKLKQENPNMLNKVLSALSRVPVIINYMSPQEIQDSTGSDLILRKLVTLLGIDWGNRYLGGRIFMDKNHIRHFFPPSPSDISQALEDN